MGGAEAPRGEDEEGEEGDVPGDWSRGGELERPLEVEGINTGRGWTTKSLRGPTPKVVSLLSPTAYSMPSEVAMNVCSSPALTLTTLRWTVAFQSVTDLTTSGRWRSTLSPWASYSQCTPIRAV